MGCEVFWVGAWARDVWCVLYNTVHNYNMAMHMAMIRDTTTELGGGVNECVP